MKAKRRHIVALVFLLPASVLGQTVDPNSGRGTTDTEQIIDVLHEVRGRGHKKPRSYCHRTRKQFLPD